MFYLFVNLQYGIKPGNLDQILVAIIINHDSTLMASIHRCPWNIEITKWNKNIYFTVTSLYQCRYNGKYHWAYNNEKQVPF